LGVYGASGRNASLSGLSHCDADATFSGTLVASYLGDDAGRFVAEVESIEL
jgi:hypothetical protein